MKKKAIYPGTFDPVTKGHIDIIIRAAKLFPELVVAVATNPTKRPFFSVEQRIGFIQEAIQGISGVTILGFDNLLIDFVREQHADVILRSLRAVADVEYEFQLANMNRKLAKDVETILLPPSEQFMYVSSTLVREIASLGGDISPFVPEFVVEAFKNKKL